MQSCKEACKIKLPTYIFRENVLNIKLNWRKKVAVWRPKFSWIDFTKKFYFFVKQRSSISIKNFTKTGFIILLNQIRGGFNQSGRLAKVPGTLWLPCLNIVYTRRTFSRHTTSYRARGCQDQVFQSHPTSGNSYTLESTFTKNQHPKSLLRSGFYH